MAKKATIAKRQPGAKKPPGPKKLPVAKKLPAAKKPAKGKKVSRPLAAKLRAETSMPPTATQPAGSRAEVLDRLWTVIVQRRSADPATSHSARLLSRGAAKVAQKFGEEAVECLIEAVLGNKTALVAESADVLYHLLVMWVAAGVQPETVWAELERREGVSGVTEKAARSRSMPPGDGTRKIP